MARELTPDAVMAAVERIMGGAFVWGVSDCCAAPCAVFDDLHGVDPMAHLRGVYAGQASARRLIREAGGMQAFADSLARAALLLRSPGVCGDIGLVRNGRGHSAAICVQPGAWAAKSEMGFVMVSTAEVAWCAR